MARFTEHVDRMWAEAFGLDVAQLHAEPARVVTPAPWLSEYQGIYVLTLGTTTLISAPATHADLAHDLAASRVDPHDVAGTFVGPSQHAYLHRDDHVAPRQATTRAVTSADLEPLRAAVPDEEWGEGGFGGHDDDIVVWAAFADDDATIVATGNLTDFGGAPADVGLVTHPDHRGRGHGRALTLDMCTWAFERTSVVRYRALTTNRASLAVARRTGFTPYGGNYAIRLPT